MRVSRASLCLPLVLAILVAPAEPIRAEGVTGGGAEEPGPADYLAVIGHAPEIRLRNSREEEVRLSDYLGRVVLVNFIYTSCPDTCPAITWQMADLQNSLRKERRFRNRVVFLTVGFDPEIDTGIVLEEYGRAFGADSDRWHFLHGTREELHPVLKDYAIRARRLDENGAERRLDHVARVYLIDPDGWVREIYNTASFRPPSVQEDIRALLAADARSAKPSRSEPDPDGTGRESTGSGGARPRPASNVQAVRAGGR